MSWGEVVSCHMRWAAELKVMGAQARMLGWCPTQEWGAGEDFLCPIIQQSKVLGSRERPGRAKPSRASIPPSAPPDQAAGAELTAQTWLSGAVRTASFRKPTRSQDTPQNSPQR